MVRMVDGDQKQFTSRHRGCAHADRDIRLILTLDKATIDPAILVPGRSNPTQWNGSLREYRSTLCEPRRHPHNTPDDVAQCFARTLRDALLATERQLGITHAYPRLVQTSLTSAPANPTPSAGGHGGETAVKPREVPERGTPCAANRRVPPRSGQNDAGRPSSNHSEAAPVRPQHDVPDPSEGSQ